MARDRLAQRLKNEYIPLQNKYQSLAELIGGIVSRLSKKTGRKYQLISNRAKDPDRLYEKVVRKKREGRRYSSLDDIEDLAGARIIFYLESDREAFVKDLHEELGEGVILSVENQIKANGYRATHIILRLDDIRTSLPEYLDYKGLKCELQITSSLYHTWSEVEHDITYKPDGDRDQLVELGLDRLEGKFQELHKHIQGASIQLDLIHEDYKQIKEFGNLLNSNLSTEITNATNDKLIEIIGLMKGFAHKKPEESYAAIEAVFSKKPLEPAVLGLIGKREIRGKSHQDVEVEALKLLERVRYFKPKETLNLLSKLLRKRSSDKEGLKDCLAKFAGFDYHYIKQVKDYGPQTLSLEFVMNWRVEQRIENFDLVEVILREILNPEIEGSEWSDEKTLTYHSGTVPTTDYLKTLRRRAINCAERLFNSTRTTAIKLRVLKILEMASHLPTSVIDEKIKGVIEEDAKYILRIYNRMIFSRNGQRLIGPLSIIQAIESKIYWWPKWGLGGDEVTEFRRRIVSDRFYSIARLLVGDFRSYTDETDDVNQYAQYQSIDELVEAVTRQTLRQWILYLNKIAKERSNIDDWQYQNFQNFIRRLSISKPSLANTILSRAFREDTPTAFFAHAFLDGFRATGRTDLWDRYANLSIRVHNAQLAKAVAGSLMIDHSNIRNSDIDKLESIVRRRNGFEFLASNKEFSFNMVLFGVLCHVWSKSPKRIERLLIHQIRSNPQLFQGFVNSLSIAVHRKSINIQEFAINTKLLLKGELIKLGNLEWHAQELLLELGKDDLDLILDVFVTRIKFEEKKKKDNSTFDLNDRYDAVPYHINPELGKFISEHPDLPGRALDMLGKMTKKWSLYNWDISHLFERVGTSGFTAIIKLAIEKGDERNLLSAAYCISTTPHVDLKTCMEVIKRTDNKRIIGLISQSILSTGVVSGEYGLSEAYQKRADALKSYVRSRNQRVKKYATDTVNYLERIATREKIDADRQAEERSLRFRLGG